MVTPSVAFTSMVLFPTTTGLYLLDTMDAFVNQFGILACALVIVIVFGAGLLGMLPRLAKHLNRHSSIKLGTGWMVLVGGVGPAALGYMLINEVQTKISESYSGYPGLVQRSLRLGHGRCADCWRGVDVLRPMEQEV